MSALYQQWRNLQGQDVRGEPGPVQGPAPPPQAQEQQQPQRQGAGVRAPRMLRAARTPQASMNMQDRHFANQAAAINRANDAIASEMQSRRKIAGQQREMAFQASEADKQRAHERQMMQMRMQPQQGSGLNHQKLDVLEGLLTNGRKNKAGGWGSVDERKYDILKRAF